MGRLCVSFNGEELDPDMFVLLYMPIELKEKVQEFLHEEGLDKKFDVFMATVGIELDEGDHQEKLAEGVKSLMLKMTSNRVLFEYKLSGKQDKLLAQINEYVYGKEES